MNRQAGFSVGVIGLGSMGMGAAQSCIRAGLATWGADISPAARAALQQAGACGVAENAREFAGQLDALLILLVNADQVREVLFSAQGVASQLKPGTPVMLSATMSADDARQIAAELQQYQLPMLDAPVSGGALKAASGEMTVMAAGSQSTFDKLAPLLNAVAAKVYRVGEEAGMGATVKIVHQLLAGVHIAAGAEAMALAARAGIPLEVMYEVVTNAAGNSWMFENRMRHVLDGDYSPRSAVDIFVKDLALVTQTGRALRFPLPLASTALTMFTSASNAGFGRQDDSAVIKIFSGISLPGAANDDAAHSGTGNKESN